MSNVITGGSTGPNGGSVRGVGSGNSSYSGTISHSSFSDDTPSYINASNAHSDYAPISFARNAYNDYSMNDILSYNYNRARDAEELYDSRMRSYMSYNTQMYRDARDWSEYMSSTAIQRQVQDLIKAGLNPMLATRLGGALYQSPNVPYITTAQNGIYDSFDSNSYNAQLDYDVNKERNDIEVQNNIRDNIVKMSISNFETKANVFMNYFENYISYLNVQERIEADKYMQEVRNYFELIENQKQRDFESEQNNLNRKRDYDIALENNIFDLVGNIIFGLSHIGSSLIFSKGNILSNVFKGIFSNSNVIDGEFFEKDRYLPIN